MGRGTLIREVDDDVVVGREDDDDVEGVEESDCLMTRERGREGGTS